jgi:hypothetical protein
MVPQPTALPCAPSIIKILYKMKFNVNILHGQAAEVDR